MSEQSAAINARASPGKFFYGWVVVAACTITIIITYGLTYSYSVFFKPLVDYFGWDRAAVSLIYSVSLLIRGAVSIGIGWLADRYGARKLMAFCGFMIGLGLVLSSQANTLWQLFLTFGVIEGIGFSGAFGIGAAVTSRWFTKNRGLPMGIIASGSGLGTTFVVPGTERLINAFGWSQSFLICGVAAGVIMIASALLLRPPPKPALSAVQNADSAVKSGDIKQTGATAGEAVKDPRMILLLAAFFFFFFGVQIIMVHLVNYATDVGISPLVAATFVSVIGAISIAGRLSAGVGSDKIGVNNTLLITGSFLIISFVWLGFTREIWAFYLFAVLFSLPYGGETTQIPLFIGKYFGTRAMATLVGLSMFVLSAGGALGAWVAGKIFDAAHSYQWAFIVGALAGVVSLALVLILYRMKR